MNSIEGLYFIASWKCVSTFSAFLALISIVDLLCVLFTFPEPTSFIPVGCPPVYIQ